MVKECVYNAGVASILRMRGLKKRKNHGWWYVGVFEMVLCFQREAHPGGD